MPQVEFEPMIPAFESAKTFHALDRSAAVVGPLLVKYEKCFKYKWYIMVTFNLYFESSVDRNID
jgi:hypothetical protein